MTFKVMKQPDSKGESYSTFERFTAKVAIYSMWIVLLSLFPILGWKALKRVKPNNALVKHRLGCKPSVKYSGIDVVLPVIDKVVEVKLFPQRLVIPPSIHYSKDRVMIESGLFLDYQVKDPALCVCELQDIGESVSFAAQAALPTCLSQDSSAMIQCSKKLVEYAVMKNINNVVSLWGVEVVSAELSPFKFTSIPDDSSHENPITKAINLIQKIAGHNPLPQKEELNLNNIVSSLKPYLTKSTCEKINAVLLLKLEGDNGGLCLVDFKNCSIKNDPKNCHSDLTIEMSVETFYSMFERKHNLMDLYKSGKVALEGDLSIAKKLKNFFLESI